MDMQVKSMHVNLLLYINLPGMYTQQIVYFAMTVGIIVGFVNTSYSVSESVGTLELYVQLIAGSIERSFPSYVEVKFSTLDITTEGGNTHSIHCCKCIEYMYTHIPILIGRATSVHSNPNLETYTSFPLAHTLYYIVSS